MKLYSSLKISNNRIQRLVPKRLKDIDSSPKNDFSCPVRSAQVEHE